VVEVVETKRYLKLSDQPRFEACYGGAAGPETGLFQGNGDIFTSFWNQAHELTWSVGKTDVWDRRYYGDNKRVVTLQEIADICKNGDPDMQINRKCGLPGSAHELYPAYDFPCPKPVGQIILRIPDLEASTNYDATLDTNNNVLDILASKGGTHLNAEAFVSATRSVAVISADVCNTSQPLRFEIYRHKDTDSARPHGNGGFGQLSALQL